MKRVHLVHLVMLLIVMLVPHESRAGIGDKMAATWNLQGSGAATESKWNVNVRQLLRANIAVLAIQEAGAPPATARLLSLGTRLHNPNSVPIPVDEYEWNLGTRSRPNFRYVYFSRNDSGANRVNLALVTMQRADEVIILRPPANYATARPLFGVRFGNDYYFSIHASANGGTDSALIVNTIMQFCLNRSLASEVMIMGDFNRSPSRLATQLSTNHPHLANDVLIQAQQQSTQVSGGNLDYAVVGGHRWAITASNVFSALFLASRLAQLSSDHTPVMFKPRPR